MTVVNIYMTAVIFERITMPRKILILNLHPAPQSLNRALAEAYAQAAQKSGHETRILHLHDLRFDMDFGQAGFKGAKALEPDLETTLQAIEWAEHLLITTPMWWGGLPGKAKALFDRAFLPGRTFDPRIKKLGLPKPLLTGRTARLILTSDTPQWYFRWAMGSPMKRQVTRQILRYVGIGPAAFTHFSPVEHSTDAIRQGWLSSIGTLGQKAA
jgi:NAD(P)H dehydrogenase (quinone)